MGNSHIGAIKLAWAKSTDHGSGLEVDFFGAHRNLLKTLYRDARGRLASRDNLANRYLKMTSGFDSPVLELPAYDAIVLHAIVNPAWALRRTIQLARHQHKTGVVVSAALAGDICLRMLRGSILHHVLKLVHGYGKIPVLFTHQPLPSIGILADPEFAPRYKGMGLLESYEGPNLHEGFMAALGDLSASMDATFLQQPASTMETSYFTSARFSRGSIRLNESMREEHPDNDYDHMNPEYGELVLAGIVAALPGVLATQR